MRYIDGQHGAVMQSISELRTDVNSLREFRGNVTGSAKAVAVIAGIVSFCVSVVAVVAMGVI